jgi:outer membrane protein OmpA-like peptidoglycan-associated protein
VNEALSLKRAQAVADLIQSKGLRVEELTVESHGERNLLVPTPDETPEPRNRRVEVTIR